MARPILMLIICFMIPSIYAQDASSYLGNNQRTGSIDVSVPTKPILRWVYKERHAPIHAWQDPSREVQFIDFDYASNVAIAEGLAIFGSSADHTVRALDLKTGDQRWILRLEAPVRFDPVVGKGCLYITGDDGFVRCVKTQTGEEVWKKRVGPKNTRCIGNDQLISRWPSRSGALLEGNKLYCTGGMWSRDGVTIYCLDAKTGEMIWKNDTCSYHFTEMPHGEGYGGVSPQGNLVLYKNVLYVPTGRSEPAFFDATTGEFLYFATGIGYKAHYPGGSWVMAAHDRVWFKRRTNHNEANIQEPDGIRDPGPSSSSGIIGWNYKTAEPEIALTEKNLAAFKNDIVVLSGFGPVIRTSYKAMVKKYRDYFDVKKKKNLAIDQNVKAPSSYGKEFGYAGDFLKSTARSSKPGKPDLKRAYPMFMAPAPLAQWQTDLGRVFCLRITKDKVIAGGRAIVSLLDLDSGKVLWDYDVDGEARNITVIEGFFIVSTTTGHIYCFGSDTSAPGKRVQAPSRDAIPAEFEVRVAKQIIADSGVKDGYCFLLGAGANPDLMLALIQQSNLVVYGLEPDAQKAAALRERLDLTGTLGVRGQVLTDSLDPLPFNPYIADLVVFGASLNSGPKQVNIEEIYRITRPCGGVAYGLNADRAWLLKVASQRELKPCTLGEMIVRGDIPGAGDWTHPLANVGRTGSSEDEVVKIPLSMLWWGGPGSARGMERHDYPPVPLYCNGRFYIQGEHDVYAVNAYNGRELWNRRMKDVGRWPQFGRGGNIVADDACVYVAYDHACYALDGATGETVRKYVIENPAQYQVIEWTKKHVTEKKHPRDVPQWDFLAITDDYVIGTLCATAASGMSVNLFLANPYEARVVFVFDKRTGKLLWSQTLDQVVASNALVSDGKNLFLLDRTNEGKFLFLRKKSQRADFKSTLRAFDLKTGKEIWSTPKVNPMAKSLLYKDGVIIAGPTRGGMDTSGKTAVIAFDAKSGDIKWAKDELHVFNAGGRNVSRQVVFINEKTLYIAPHAFDLNTGKEVKPLTDPITGEAACFEIRGQNFCGGVSASKYLAAYRSTSVGLQEIDKNSGSFWLPEVRSSCEISLLPAGGIVLSAEGSSTCVCSFSYKTSLALFPEPKLEDWSLHFDENTYGPHKAKNKAVKPKPGTDVVKHLRLNLNAPGDKTDTADQTWFAYPREWVKSTKFVEKTLPVKGRGIQSQYHLNADRHTVKNTERPWLYTSGVYGPVELDVKTQSNDDYTVILHFAEMRRIPTESRVFDIRIGDKTVTDLNIAQEGGKQTAVIKTIRDVKPVNGKISIKLTPQQGRPPVLCAVEVIKSIRREVY